jgi:putative spermidine/putrescine transport system permease protein
MADSPAAARPRVAHGLGIVLLLAPALLLLAVFFLLPLYELLRVSTLPGQAAVLHGNAWHTLTMYGRGLGDPFYRELMLNSVLVGLASTVAVLLLGYPVAFYLTRTSGLERTLISAACLLPLFVNAIVGILGWYILLLPYGVIQQILVGLGAWSGPLRVLHTFPALIAVLTYEHVPFAVLLLVASLQAIPPERINAARLLGAGTVRIIWTLILPLSMPGLVATAVLVFSLGASSYLTPILIGGQSMRVMPLTIFTYGTDLLNWPLAAALSFLMLLVVGLIAYGFSLAMHRLTRRDAWRDI